jgi:hypothetical protein
MVSFSITVSKGLMLRKVRAWSKCCSISHT